MMSLNHNLYRAVGFYSGVLMFVLILQFPAPQGMESVAWKTVAVAILMAIWWITEVIPIAVTSLLPIVLFPIMRIATIGEATTPYSNPVIFLFLGGFVLAIAMQTWNLHKRIALSIIYIVGVKPSRIIMGFIIASAFLSMWISNTATAMMMLPIALSVISVLGQEKKNIQHIRNFEIVLLLAIAYACNIGGIGTLIGTPPNALFAAFMLENYGVEVGFAQWMAIGIPLVIVLLPLMYLILTRLTYPIHLKKLHGGKELIRKKIDALGPVTTPEKRVAIVFGLTALFWIFRPLASELLPGLSDTGIALTSCLVMFILPAGTKPGQKIVEWQNTKAMPWDILILFGGGLSLAMAINTTGLANYIGLAVSGLIGIHIIFLILFVVLLILFLTEITSNTATTSAFLPILASMALGIAQNPMLFILPAAIASSCAFMLPVATPPNAIIFGSRKVSIQQMVKAGFLINIISSIVLTLMVYLILIYIMGIEIDVIPNWVN